MNEKSRTMYIQLCKIYSNDASAAERRRLKKMSERRRKLYFAKQKTVGLICFLVGLLSIYFLKDDITLAIFAIPLGLMCMFSKEIILIDKYMEWGNVYDKDYLR